MLARMMGTDKQTDGRAGGQTQVTPITLRSRRSMVKKLFQSETTSQDTHSIVSCCCFITVEFTHIPEGYVIGIGAMI